MAKVFLTTLAFLCASVAAAAQPSGNYGYVFGGPVVVPRSAFTRWDGTFVHVGGGGEGRLTNKFGLGGELGVLKPVTNRDAVTTVLASVTSAYHFISRDSNRKIDPFVEGGFSFLFGRGSGAAVHIRRRTELLGPPPDRPAPGIPPSPLVTRGRRVYQPSWLPHRSSVPLTGGRVWGTHQAAPAREAPPWLSGGCRVEAAVSPEASRKSTVDGRGLLPTS